MSLKWTSVDDSKLLDLYNKWGDNWELIAQNFRTKTKAQIKRRFVQDLHPDNGTEHDFNEEETSSLLASVHTLGENWMAVSEAMGTKTPWECYQNWQALNSSLSAGQGKLSPEQHTAVEPTSSKPDPHNQQSRRYFSRVPWSDQENEILRQAIKQYDHDFSSISKLLPNRTTSQVRTHWINALDESIKTTPWGIEEDV
eukprot:TRINITY_DN484_c1_g2_i7.p1 TRINITY_DN484_c1_g2~~TRINITY_DN484_c1_g2_i7.p1  ORF type:complete len:198 (-),score=32.53 TRINITY_DN484_c1_g2_i7:192-785(-)